MPNMQQETCEYFLPNWHQCMISSGMPCHDMGKLCRIWRWKKPEKKRKIKKQTWFDVELVPYSRHHYKDSKGVRF